MKIAITGGTGFVGSTLTTKLLDEGNEVIVFTRWDKKSEQKNLTFIKWNPMVDNDVPELNNIDVFINLAGETINQTWKDENKKSIVKSRILVARALEKIISKMDLKPKVLIQASAVGYYGTSLNKTFTEDDSAAMTDFLSITTNHWENAAAPITDLGVRTVFCRFGIILDSSGGALEQFATPYKFYIGGKVGTGKQIVSWIHLDDVVEAILFAIKTESLTGPVNFTAPNAVEMNTFGKTLSNVLKKPHWFPTPSFIIELIFGERSILILEGQRAVPKKLIENGFTFLYPNLEKALREIFDKK